MKQVTKTNFKSFIKKAGENLFIKVESKFNGMTDCVENVKESFQLAEKTESNIDNTFGYCGIWLVGGGRDYFQAFENNEYVGIKYFNSYGSGVVAIKK